MTGYRPLVTRRCRCVSALCQPHAIPDTRAGAVSAIKRTMAMDTNALILVVDDDPELRNLIAGFLSGHGYRVQAAENVAQMDLAISRERPDLVVLDVMMPGEDGLSAARRLAAEKGPPIIILSALGGDTDRIIGLEVGADDYLAKPCNPRELLARVRAICAG